MRANVTPEAVNQPDFVDASQVTCQCGVALDAADSDRWQSRKHRAESVLSGDWPDDDTGEQQLNVNE